MYMLEGKTTLFRPHVDLGREDSGFPCHLNLRLRHGLEPGSYFYLGIWIKFPPWNLCYICSPESGSYLYLGTWLIFPPWNLNHICSMVAEIGGYSGLLLGFSLMDTVAVFSHITKWMFSPAE